MAKQNSPKKEQKNKKVVLDIGGMSCVTCSQTIEKRLSKLKGVTQATVNFAAEKAIVDYDPNALNPKTIEDAIVEVGYKVVHDSVSLKITGMSCVTCA